MAQQGALNPGGGPAAQLVAGGHAADLGRPDAGVQRGDGDQLALGVVVQLRCGRIQRAAEWGTDTVRLDTI